MRLFSDIAIYPYNATYIYNANHHVPKYHYWLNTIINTISFMHHYTIIICYIYIHYTYHKMPFLPLTSFLRFHDSPFAKVRGRTKGESDTPPAVAAEASGDSRPGI